MGTLALLDIVSPYLLAGSAIGDPLHELLAALHVEKVESAFDDNGVAVWGMARFSANLTANPPRFTPPASITFAGAVAVQPQPRHAGAWWDLPDIAIRFRLTAPRNSSPVADAVVGTLVNVGVRTVLQGYAPTAGQPAGDGPGTVFHLDLLLDAATLRLPFLTGALLQNDGMLAADPAHPGVSVTFPKIKLSFEQTAGGGGADPQLAIALDSWAAHDIDDPAGTAYAEIVQMSPPFALFGPDNVLGFGFQSVILDLSATETPPELLAKFGVGDEFRGVYLPDVRVFVKVPGAAGLGIDVSARELLIGIGPEGGVSGIFGLDVVKPSAPQSATVTIYDQYGALVRRLESPAPADTTSPVPTWVFEPVHVPATTKWVVDVVGGQPPYNITVDGTVQTTAPVTVTLAAGTTGRNVAIAVTDIHTGGQSRAMTVPIVLTAPSLTAPPPGGGDRGVTVGQVTAGPPGHTITLEDNPHGEQVTLVFTPPDPATATVDRGSGPTALPVSGGRATIPLAHGQHADLAATWAVPAVAPDTPLTLQARFQYDQPLAVPNQDPQNPDDPAWAAFAAVPTNIRTIASADAADPNGGWTEDDHFLIGSQELAGFVAAAAASPAAAFALTGTASKEHVANQTYNVGLSQRRIWALKALLRAQGVANPVSVESPQGENPPGPPYLQPGRGGERKCVATLRAGGTPASTAAAAIHVARPDRLPSPPVITPTVTRRQPADAPAVQFRELHVRVEIDHNRLIAVELRLKIDVETALEHYLTTVKDNAGAGQIPGPALGSTNLPVRRQADPTDGTLDIRVQVTLDDTVDRWQVLASLFENDKDGFLQTPPPTATGLGTDAQQLWRSFFGILIAITPLIDAAAASNTPQGDVAALVVAAGVPLAAMGLHVVSVPRITLYGGEAVVAHDATGTRFALLLDVEVALIVTLDVGGTKIIDTDPKNPITVRYKAVGFKTSDTPQVRDLIPVFDSSKGYTIKIPSTGGIKVPDPLGDILQIVGTRIARSNPVNLELDLELKVDLGVVSIDKTTIRIPIEGGHAPTISALGVHIDVPGAIEGHGYLAIYPDGFAGQLDVSLPSVGIRVSAGLSVRHVQQGARTATAVLVTLEVDFPVPIALGASGLGIYGFGGLFALHHSRTENPSSPLPALDWYQDVVHGVPTDIAGWTPDIDHWSIGLGAVLGTMDTGFTLNVKGMLIFEMPGPRILLVMKANLIKSRPQRKGKVNANIIAVIDLDLGRGRISIALIFDYEIDPLLKVHIPVRAIFPFQDVPHFAIDAGSWYAPATVEFFKLFTARGYFMIRGRGIPDTTPGSGSYDAGHDGTFPLPYTLGGFSIATGVGVSFLWGSRSSGLYLSVGASIDVGLGFSPIMFTGVLKLWGELHLWIIGIEADAQLTVTAGQVPVGTSVPDPDHPGNTIKPTKNLVLIDGEVHGKIDLFFFTIEGSVHVRLGDHPSSPSAPPPLVTGVSLQSRAAALLTGMSSDRPIDGKLADAREDGSAVPAAEAVPIDAVVVVHFDCQPRVLASATFTVSQGGASVAAVLGNPAGPAAPAVRRGEPYYTYRVTGITLDHGVTKGAVPVVWWPGQPNPGPETKRELALLTRVPDPHPCAVERSKHQEDLLEQEWATICARVALPSSVLWTFHDSPPGPSTVGWVLTGTAWPDPPGTTRYSAPGLRLDVAEMWRSADPAADLLVDIAPARVIGGRVVCDPVCLDRESPVRGKCFARLLEAPFLRVTDRKVLDRHPLGDVLVKLRDLADEQRKEQLDDVVAFATGGVVLVRMLLLAPRRVYVAGRLLLRSFAADGRLLGEVRLDGNGADSRPVSSPADLPATWWDPAGPWRCRVAEAMDYMGSLGLLMETYGLLLVDSRVPEGTAYVQVGIADVAREPMWGRPSYLVGVVETLTTAEVERHDLESASQSTKITTLNGALEPMHDPQALLLPATDYTLNVAWEWATCDADGQNVGSYTTVSPQAFHFKTDDRALAPATVERKDGNPPVTMPRRLDPWVLLTDPDEGEHFYFHGRPIRVTFAVDYLLDLFATYGEFLQAKVRAASYANDDPSSPGYAKSKIVLDPSLAMPLVGSVVFTPWEGGIRQMLDTTPEPVDCVDTSGSVSRQTVLNLNLLLEPRTDYVFDIEPVNAPAPAPGTTVAPLFRRAFTTSRYADAEHLAAAVAAGRVTEAAAVDATIQALTDLATAPGSLSGAVLDTALRQAGLRPVVEVTDPEVDVLWVPSGSGLQPRVLVIRTPEPLVRTRREPEEYEPPGQPRLQRKVVRLVDKPYLEVVPSSGVAGAPALTVVSRPGMNTVVVLVTGGRGKPIRLSLGRHDNALLGEGSGTSEIPLLSLDLDAATWEVA